MSTFTDPNEMEEERSINCLPSRKEFHSAIGSVLPVVAEAALHASHAIPGLRLGCQTLGCVASPLQPKTSLFRGVLSRRVEECIALQSVMLLPAPQESSGKADRRARQYAFVPAYSPRGDCDVACYAGAEDGPRPVGGGRVRREKALMFDDVMILRGHEWERKSWS